MDREVTYEPIERDGVLLGPARQPSGPADFTLSQFGAMLTFRLSQARKAWFRRAEPYLSTGLLVAPGTLGPAHRGKTAHGTPSSSQTPR